ncbi:MAG: transposase [Terracidiphilus sp.]
MYYIGLDVHKKTISFCVKDAAGRVCQEGKIGSTRYELDAWIATLPQPRMIAMEATIFTGWIYDHLLPHAEKVKVAHPLMLRAIAAAKRKNDTIDARKIADCLRCDLLPECHMASTEIRDRRRTLRYRNLVLRQAVQMKNRVSGLLMETGVSYNKLRLHRTPISKQATSTSSKYWWKRPGWHHVTVTSWRCSTNENGSEATAIGLPLRWPGRWLRGCWPWRDATQILCLPASSSEARQPKTLS